MYADGTFLLWIVNRESVYFHGNITSLENELRWCDGRVVDLAEPWPGPGRDILGFGLLRHTLGSSVLESYARATNNQVV